MTALTSAYARGTGIAIDVVAHPTSESAAPAGPEMTSPVGLNREPWHGQSHVRSAVFHPTMHPMCVHVAERRVTDPAGSRYAATFEPFRSMTLPEPRFTARTDCASPPPKRSRI